MKTYTEYQVQYRFSPRGCWHSDGEILDSDKEHAEHVMEVMKSACGEGTPYGKFFGVPKQWRIAKRQVTDWEDARYDPARPAACVLSAGIRGCVLRRHLRRGRRKARRITLLSLAIAAL